MDHSRIARGARATEADGEETAVDRRVVTGILKPRLVAFDTAQLGQWASDRSGANAVNWKTAQTFESQLFEHGIVPLLCWHHFAELLGTQNWAAASSRVALIRSLRTVAWITPADGSEGLGTAADILAREVKAILESGDQDMAIICANAAKEMISFGSGAQAVAPYTDGWRDLQPELWLSAERQREIVAIDVAKMADLSEEKVMSFLAGRTLQPSESAQKIEALRSNLADQIQSRGDKRIKDPGDVADKFFDGITKRAPSKIEAAGEFIVRVLSAHEVDLSDINSQTTIGELGALSVFRHRLKVVANSLRLPFETLKSVDMHSVPSWIIDSALRTHRPDVPERKGSELIDRYLTTLAPYVDVIFVDGQNWEGLRRAGSKIPELANFLGQVRKSVAYYKVPSLLAKQ